MGVVPPPNPLGQKEFKKRWDAGARTMKELDPEFCKWCEKQQKYTYMTIFIYVLAGTTLAVVLASMLFSCYSRKLRRRNNGTGFICTHQTYPIR